MSAALLPEEPPAGVGLLELLHASNSAGSPPRASAAMPPCRSSSRRVNRIDGASGRSLMTSLLAHDRSGLARSWTAGSSFDDVLRALQRVEPQTDHIGSVLDLERFDHVVVRVVDRARGLQKRGSRGDAELFRSGGAARDDLDRRLGPHRDHTDDVFQVAVERAAGERRALDPGESIGRERRAEDRGGLAVDRGEALDDDDLLGGRTHDGRDRSRGLRPCLDEDQDVHVRATGAEALAERAEDRDALGPWRLAQERPASGTPVEDALLDQIEDRLADRREGHAVAIGQLLLRRERSAGDDLSPLDHLDQQGPDLEVERNGEAAVDLPARTDSLHHGEELRVAGAAMAANVTTL